MKLLLAIIVLITLVLTPISFLVFIIQLLRKKAAKIWGIIAAVSMLLFYVSALMYPWCEHEWQNATCETPEMCSLCGEQVGEPFGHKWADATCSRGKKCILCGKLEGEALGHNWIKETCAQAKHCDRCGLEDGAPLPHEWLEANCTEPKRCVNCIATEGEPLGHDTSNMYITMQPTCSEEGLAEGICLICQQQTSQILKKIEHTPGEWIIVKEATENEEGQRNRICVVCNETLPTEAYSLSDEELKQLYINSCENYTYEEISRNPDKCMGNRAVFTGEVIQVQQNIGWYKVGYTMRVDITNTGNGYTDTVYVTYSADIEADRILEGDIVMMYGELSGMKTYTTVIGNKVTIPYFQAKYITIQ